jgi:hypothetical protein
MNFSPLTQIINTVNNIIPLFMPSGILSPPTPIAPSQHAVLEEVAQLFPVINNNLL